MSVNHSVHERLHSDTTAPAAPTGRRPRRGRTDPPTPTTDDTAGGGSLTRVTANFTPRAMAALDEIVGRTHDSKTDALNRAVLVYQVFLELIEERGGSLRVRYEDGTEEALRFLG